MSQQTTLLGRTLKEWHIHIDHLFSIANVDEEIPESALLYAWPGTPTEEDIVWAKSQLSETN